MNWIIFSETCGTGNIDENEIGCPETDEMEVDSDFVRNQVHDQVHGQTPVDHFSNG